MATAYQGNEPYIFLSYAHKDKELAHYVVDYLQAHNNYVWFDEGIHTGAQWKKFILEKIANPNCWMMVFLATQNSLVSDECEKELYFAYEKNKKFINVVIGSPQFPDWFICDFKRYQFVDGAEFASRDEMLDKLVEELIHHQMNPDKPKDTPKDTTTDTPKETSAVKPLPTPKASEVAEVPKASVPTQKSSEPSVAPKDPFELVSDDGLEFSIVDGTAKVTSYKGTDTEVIIPAKITYDGKTYKVTAIGATAFDHCTNLTSIAIPDSVTSIGKWAFEWCENLTTINVDQNNSHYKSIDGNLYSKDGTILIKYAIGKTETSFTIPDHVTSIGEGAFAYCENLTSITIPDGITSIGEGAFAYCENLTSITIPDGITTIGESAFSSCTNLTSIEVDENNQNYKSIDGNLYTKDGSTLVQYAAGKTAKSFTIPNGVTTIGKRAFADCTSLTSITIPDSVTSIGEMAFEGCKYITSITIPDSVTSIGESAFFLCKKLTSITIPDSVTSIGEKAFSLCENLTSITIPNSVTSISKSAFWGCKSLTSITIPDSVTSIGERAFYKCENLTSITIPDSVTTISKEAFRSCTNLTIYCEAKSKPEGWHTNWNRDNRPVTWGCESSKRSVVPKGPLKLSTDKGLQFTITDGTATVIGYKGTDSNVIIPSAITYNGKTYKVTSIGKKAFSFHFGDLTSITIPDSVTIIGDFAFDGCDNLTSITIPNSVTSIGESAFFGCSSLTSITIPDSVTSIGEGAFFGCDNLTSIIIPDSVTSIGESTYGDCENLTIYCEAKSKPKGWHTDWNSFNRPVVWNVQSVFAQDGITYAITKANFATVGKYIGTATKVTIPSTITIDSTTYTVTTIEKWAFYGCSSLTTVTIPDSVTSIGDYAFLSCKNLTSITIPDSVTSIGERAFYRCIGLTSVTIPNGVTSIGYCAFDGCSSLTSITIPDTVTSIGEGAFYECSNLTSITIPDSVTSIGRLAFCNCDSLTSIDVDKNNTHYKSIDGNLYSKDGSTLIQYAIGKTATSFTIPNSVTSIGERAFKGCTNLTSITIPNSVTSIGDCAFWDCTNLTSITIPNSVTTIGEDAFWDCTNLTSITIPDSVTTIGDWTFKGCKNLTSITIPDSITSIGDSAFYECKNLTIYCEAKSKPRKWHTDWNPHNCPVVWEHKIK